MNTKRAEIMDVETLPALQIEAERREEGVMPEMMPNVSRLWLRKVLTPS